MINYILYFLKLIEEGNPPASSPNLIFYILYGLILGIVLCLMTISIGIAISINRRKMNKEKVMKIRFFNKETKWKKEIEIKGEENINKVITSTIIYMIGDTLISMDTKEILEKNNIDINDNKVSDEEINKLLDYKYEVTIKDE